MCVSEHTNIPLPTLALSRDNFRTLLYLLVGATEFEGYVIGSSATGSRTFTQKPRSHPAWSLAGWMAGSVARATWPSTSHTTAMCHEQANQQTCQHKRVRLRFVKAWQYNLRLIPWLKVLAQGIRGKHVTETSSFNTEKKILSRRIHDSMGAAAMSRRYETCCRAGHLRG